jgi:excisionase family DNA binding protein
MKKELLTPSEVAKLFGVSPVTVRKWSQDGLLNAVKTPGGHRRYRKKEIYEYLTKRGFPLPEDDAWTPRVMIVDDDKVVINLMKMAIEEAYTPVDIQSAMNGFDAARALTKFRPDLVLLDLKMPGMDGIEVTKQIKLDPEMKNTKIYMITGFDSEENKKTAIDAGVDFMLSKPIEKHLLIEALNPILKRS